MNGQNQTSLLAKEGGKEEKKKILILHKKLLGTPLPNYISQNAVYFLTTTLTKFFRVFFKQGRLIREFDALSSTFTIIDTDRYVEGVFIFQPKVLWNSVQS